MFDAVDVEKMVFVIIDDKSFHLGGVHSAIGLRHIQNWYAQIGKHIARHSRDRKQAGQYNRNDQDQNRDWPPERKGNQIHSAYSECLQCAPQHWWSWNLQASGKACCQVSRIVNFQNPL